MPIKLKHKKLIKITQSKNKLVNLLVIIINVIFLIIIILPLIPTNQIK